MIFTFFKAEGISVGKSLVEDDQLELAKKVKESAQSKGVEFLLPVDVVLADIFSEDAKTQVADVTKIPDGWMVSCEKLTCLLPVPVACKGSDQLSERFGFQVPQDMELCNADSMQKLVLYKHQLTDS